MTKQKFEEALLRELDNPNVWSAHMGPGGPRLGKFRLHHEKASIVIAEEEQFLAPRGHRVLNKEGLYLTTLPGVGDKVRGIFNHIWGMQDREAAQKAENWIQDFSGFGV